VVYYRGLNLEILGEPDFLIREGDGFLIRDSKVSRRISDKDHPEILRQLQLYGWLYHQVFGAPPLRLEVHSGSGEIVSVPYDNGIASLALLEEIVRLKQASAEPYSPVGWSKCSGCGYFNRCWPRAEAGHLAALVPDVDQGLAIALREDGINTIKELCAAFDEPRLSDYRRPWGTRMQKVGKKAQAILKSAEAMASGKEIPLEPQELPQGPNYVVFDVEGLPPHLDEIGKVYLWGLQVFGNTPGPFLAATSGFGVDGDREAWNGLLAMCAQIFAEHGDLAFLHWHHYEKTKLDAYIKQYGDPDGVAARVKRNLLDLLPITKKSIALPLPSYSLKVIEKYVGFERSQEDYGGDWAMAKYIEAAETSDEELRASTIDQILKYNREDLEATWAVFRWLRSKLRKPT